MLKASAGTIMPTTVTGSLPRPSWYTENLGLKSFLDAMVISRFREQYVDALSVYLREQEVAGLDIVTDGDCRFDQDVGGQSWTSYPPHHMAGFDTQHPQLATVGAGGIAFPRGHILHDYLEARVMPKIVGPLGRGEMMYAEIFADAQRLTRKAFVKFGTRDAGAGGVCRCRTKYYGKISCLSGSPVAMSNAFNEELHDLADAGCQVILSWKSRRFHLPLRRAATRSGHYAGIHAAAGLQQHGEAACGAKTEVWCWLHVLGQPVAAAHVRQHPVLQVSRLSC